MARCHTDITLIHPGVETSSERWRSEIREKISNAGLITDPTEDLTFIKRITNVVLGFFFPLVPNSKILLNPNDRARFIYIVCVTFTTATVVVMFQICSWTRGDLVLLMLTSHQHRPPMTWTPQSCVPSSAGGQVRAWKSEKQYHSRHLLCSYE